MAIPDVARRCCFVYGRPACALLFGVRSGWILAEKTRCERFWCKPLVSGRVLGESGVAGGWRQESQDTAGRETGGRPVMVSTSTWKQCQWVQQTCRPAHVAGAGRGRKNLTRHVLFELSSAVPAPRQTTPPRRTSPLSAGLLQSLPCRQLCPRCPFFSPPPVRCTSLLSTPNSATTPVRLDIFLSCALNPSTATDETNTTFCDNSLSGHRGACHTAPSPRLYSSLKLAPPQGQTASGAGKLAGLRAFQFSFIRPLLGPRPKVLLGGDLKPP